ncbi:MAG: hypothetical protein GY941_12350 [Planctomycetes bacterium]|nr:hypothetical protein [Planctomycetota bacterium]
MTRSASASIRGYSYQFHKTIYDLLSFDNSSHQIIVEGIEDVEKLMGKKQEAVQIKYQEAKKLTPSVVKKPVMLMLEDYVQNTLARTNTHYRLYGHYGKGVSNKEFWNKIEFFQDCRKSLIEDRDKDIDEIDDSLLGQLKDRFQLEIGPSHGDLEQKVRELLLCELNATEKEVEYYYYNNAVNVILGISILDDPKDRKISKVAFLKKINKKSVLFGLWQKIELGKQKYKAVIKSKLKPDFIKPKKRLVLIDTGSLSADNTGYKLYDLVRDLLHAHNPINQLDNTEPLTLVIQADDNEINGIKSAILEMGLEYNDGHEDTAFSADSFNAHMVINVANRSHKIKKASYHVKIMSATTYEKHILEIEKPHTAIHVTKAAFPYTDGFVYYHISELETYRDISEILN